MNLKEMEAAVLEARKAEISKECETEGADLDALLEEVRAINEELEARKAEEAKKAELRTLVAEENVGEEVEEIVIEERKEEVTPMEIRNSVEYINAFANYLKTGKDDECRSLLTENVSGTVPVPEFVEARIKTAWERNEIMNLVRKTYLKGNVKIGYEISATGAVKHTEGAAAPAEETLTLGIVTMIPASFKKWITISDEAEDLGGEEFINYIYDELTYQISKAVEADLLSTIASSTAPAIATVTGGLTTANLIAAEGALSGDAKDLTVVISRANMAALKAAALSASYAYDPFDGMRVVVSDSLPSGTLAIVGDFYYGAQANFPNGYEVRVKRDDLSLAESDLVKYVGREFVGLGVVAPYAFAKITA